MQFYVGHFRMLQYQTAEMALVTYKWGTGYVHPVVQNLIRETTLLCLLIISLLLHVTGLCVNPRLVLFIYKHSKNTSKELLFCSLTASPVFVFTLY